jgi:DNA-binding LytR/AlgR family response regulator
MADSRRRVIIVDDEPAARFALRAVIDDFPELEVVAELGDGQDAVDAIESLAPDLVFLDIDMPGVDGFGVAEATRHVHYHLVFVTAHHEYALDAFATHAVDFLPKPARPALISKCINKILRQEELAQVRLVPRHAGSAQIVLVDRGVSRVVACEHILLIDAIGRYRRILLTEDGADIHGQSTLISDMALDDFEDQLSESDFLRVHRSYIVNARRIIAVRTRNRRHFVELRGYGEDVPVARSRVAAVKGAL